MNEKNGKRAHRRIAFSGGPGGGKTTAVDIFRRELGDDFVIVPETATMLFLGGFPRCEDPASTRAMQTAIFRVQRSLEDIQAIRYSERTLFCDRGTVDGGVYWPGGPDAFFAAQGTTLDAELDRYAAVLFFESAAVGNISIEGGNRTRTETIPEAVALDGKLRALWARHPRFKLVPHQPSFFHKIETALGLLRQLLVEIEV